MLAACCYRRPMYYNKDFAHTVLGGSSLHAYLITVKNKHRTGKDCGIGSKNYYIKLDE